MFRPSPFREYFSLPSDEQMGEKRRKMACAGKAGVSRQIITKQANELRPSN